MRPTSVARWERGPLRRRGRKQQRPPSAAVGQGKGAEPTQLCPGTARGLSKAQPLKDNPEVVGSNPSPATTRNTVRPWGGLCFCHYREGSASLLRVMRPASVARWERGPLRRRGRKQQRPPSAAVGQGKGAEPARLCPGTARGLSKAQPLKDNPEVVGSNPSPATTQESQFVYRGKRASLL